MRALILAVLTLGALGARNRRFMEDPPAAPPAAAAGKPTYDLDGFKTEWHQEWRHGDFPDWKTEKNYANYYVEKGFEDKQSDQKPSPAYGNLKWTKLAQTAAKEDPAPATPAPETSPDAVAVSQRTTTTFSRRSGMTSGGT